MTNGTSTPADAPPERMDRLPQTMDRIAAALEKHNDLAGDKRDSPNGDKPGEDKGEKVEESKAEQAKGEDEKKSGKTKRFFVSPLGIVLELVVLTMLVVAGVEIWKYITTHVSTDDAYTTADVHQISSRVAGTVIEVWVADNQRVKAGSLLVKLDTSDYRIDSNEKTPGVMREWEVKRYVASAKKTPCAGVLKNERKEPSGSAGASEATLPEMGKGRPEPVAGRGLRVMRV